MAGVVVAVGEDCILMYGSEVWSIVQGAYTQCALAICSLTMLKPLSLSLFVTAATRGSVWMSWWTSMSRTSSIHWAMTPRRRLTGQPLKVVKHVLATALHEMGSPSARSSSFSGPIAGREFEFTSSSCVLLSLKLVLCCGRRRLVCAGIPSSSC